MNFLNKLQGGLTVAQFIPGLNTVAGLANAAIDIYQGNYGSALLNVLGAIPVAGVAIKTIAATTKVVSIIYKAKALKAVVLLASAKKAAKGGVYVLKDVDLVVRSGRTKNLVLREAQHLRDKVLGKFKFETQYASDVYEEQRGLEEVVAKQFENTASSANGGFNKINAISGKNDKILEYRKAAEEFLKKNK